MNKDNTQQLPAEVLKREQQLENDPGVSIAYIEGFKEGKTLTATEYAAKLHEVNQLIKDWEEVDKDKKRLVREIDNIISGGMPAKQASLCDLVNPIRKLQEKHNDAVDLLEKFIDRHEAGLLPDRFIYDEIKIFLDGK